MNNFKLSFVLVLLLFNACSPKEDEISKESKSITIAFTGDILLDRVVSRLIDSLGHEEFILKTSKIQADILIGNFENPAAPSGIKRAKKFSFNADPRHLNILNQLGFDYLNLSNNHSIDCGTAGLKSTADQIKAFQMKTSGFGKNTSEACAPTIIKKNGIRIALFSTSPIPIENYYPSENNFTICQASSIETIDRIHKHQQDHPNDYIFVQLHWGTEYHVNASPTQKKQAHDMIAAGADVIIGHHPHVVQEYEQYLDGHIFYSLGNYIFDLSDSSTHWTIVPLFKILPDQISVTIDTLSTHSIIPQKRIKE